MFISFREFAKYFIASPLGWALVIANLLVFLYLLEEFEQVRKFTNVQCDESGNVMQFGLVSLSDLLLFHESVNSLPSLVAESINRLIFPQYFNPCRNYSFREYPFLVGSKYAVELICESVQWFLLGNFFEKTYKFLKAQTYVS